MKFTMELIHLNHALAIVKDTIGNDTHGHKGIRIHASKKNNRIKLTTTDGHNSTEMWVDAVNVEKAGTVVVEADRFIRYLQKLDVKEVTVTDKSGKIEVKSKRGKPTFLLYDAQGFPELPKLDKTASIFLPGKLYRELVNGVAFSTRSEDKKGGLDRLMGVHITSNGSHLQMFASNGLMIAATKKKMKTPVVDAILFKKSLVNSARIAKDDEQVTIQSCNDQVFLVKVRDTTYYIPTIAGTFPDFASVMPKKDSFDAEFTIDKEEILGSLERSTIVLASKEAVRGTIHLETKGVTLSGETQEGIFSETLHTKVEGKASDVKVDVKSLIDIIKNINADRIHFGVTNGRPLSVRPAERSDHTCLLSIVGG
jgi:DNA polymerase-3 subunit beta